MSSQSWGGYIPAELFSGFIIEVLLVVLSYGAFSSLRAWSSAVGGGKRRGGVKVVEGGGAEPPPPPAAAPPRTQPRDRRQETTRAAPSTMRLRVPLADIGGCPFPVDGKAPGGPSKFPQREAACVAEVCAALKTKNWRQVLEIIHGMYQQGIYPSGTFYNHVMLMGKWGKQWELVVATFLLMQAHGVTPWVSAWKMYCTATDYLQGRTEAEEHRRPKDEPFASPEDRGFKSEVNTYRFMIFIYGIETQPYPDFARLKELAGELQRAKLCLTTSTYNAMLAACQEPVRFVFASNIFGAMLRSGCVPDIFTLTVLVRICARQASTSASDDRGRRFVSQLLTQQFKPDVTYANAALDTLKGEKDWTVALEVLEAMKCHGMAIHAETYKKVIEGFQASRQFDYAVQVAEECVTRCPQLESLDLPFYKSLLGSCNECNNSSSAMLFFEEMQRYHAPGVEEYNALLKCLMKCNCEAVVERVLLEMGAAGVEKDRLTERILAARQQHLLTDDSE